MPFLAAQKAHSDFNSGELVTQVPPGATHLIAEGRPSRIGIQFGH